MLVGSFGKILFTVSDLRTLTFNGLSRKSGATFATHDLISGKPRKQFMGPQAQTVDLEILVRADMGNSPRLTIAELRKMMEKGEAARLIVGGIPVTDLPLVITSMSDEWDVVYQFGGLFQARISLTLEEYR